MATAKTQKPMKRITVTVDPEDYAAFDAISKSSDVTTSWLIRRAMREFLDQHGSGEEVRVVLGGRKRTK